MTETYMLLKDKTRVDIEAGAFLDNLVHIADTEEDAVEVCNKITKQNISHIEFYSGDSESPYAVYENLAVREIPTRQNEMDENDEPTGRVIVIISLRSQSEIEVRVSALENSQTDIEMALADVYEMIV